MNRTATDTDPYFEALSPERLPAMLRLRDTIRDNIPQGFEEALSYGLPGWVVPHSVYPPGYHCSPELPLPYMSIASQKNFIAVYHMGVYAIPALLEWFQAEYAVQVPTKLDMGKSCIRLKKPDQIPYDLIGELAGRLSASEWVACYEAQVKR